MGISMSNLSEAAAAILSFFSSVKFSPEACEAILKGGLTLVTIVDGLGALRTCGSGTHQW